MTLAVSATNCLASRAPCRALAATSLRGAGCGRVLLGVSADRYQNWHHDGDDEPRVQHERRHSTLLPGDTHHGGDNEERPQADDGDALEDAGERFPSDPDEGGHGA